MARYLWYCFAMPALGSRRAMRHLMLGFFEWLITLVKTAGEMGNGPGLEGRVSSAGGDTEKSEGDSQVELVRGHRTLCLRRSIILNTGLSTTIGLL